MQKKRLPSRSRLKTGREFARVFSDGRRLTGRYLVVIYRSVGETGSTPSGKVRVGFVTPKKLAKAHDRNRLRRWLREAYRCHQTELSKNFEMILLGRAAAVRAGYEPIETELCKLWRNAGLIKPSDS